MSTHANRHGRTDATASANSNSSSLRNAREKLAAIRFLSLVARCPAFSWRGNPRFWWHVLHVQCRALNCEAFIALPPTPRKSAALYRNEPPSCAAAKDAGPTNVMPCFQLDFSCMEIDADTLSLCVEAFSTDPMVMESTTVDLSTEKLLAKAGAAIPRSPLSVEIGLCINRCQQQDPHSLRRIQDLLVSGDEGSSSGVSFAVRRLDLSGTALTEHDFAMLAQALASPKHSVRELGLRHAFTSQTPTRYMAAFSQLMAACFAVPPFDSRGDDGVSWTSLRKLDLSSNTLRASHFASLFSAIRASDGLRGVRELSLRHSNEEKALPWLWLAFGLLHPTSKARITHLDLSFSVLRLEDVALVRKLLAAEDCAPLLMQKNRKRVSRGQPKTSGQQWVLLPATTPLEAPRRPGECNAGKVVLMLPTEQWCEALECGNKWTCVLMSAYGKLWVKSSRILKTERRPWSREEARTRHLKSLTMNAMLTISPILRVGRDGHTLHGSEVTQRVDRVLSEWVQVVGQSLQSLRLCSNPLTNHTLEVILASCPQLQHLDVESCELTRVTAITDAFAGGRCQLRTLNLAENEITTDSQVSLIQMLGDPECAAARNLHELHLERNSRDRTGVLTKALLLMLRKNKTLRLLTLTMDTKQDAMTSRRFERRQGEWLGCERLPLEHQLALLSVPSMQMLPIATVRIVFALTASDIYRQIVWA
ncbi:hypothetical protein BBJ28_00000424 [Nothophytophthora sp. Chile5]|nr:hypothetical protein BBJ28_00000424 [Nothophytophthora sp. Chile5]